MNRKSVLTSRVHAVSFTHNKDLVLPPPRTGFAGGRRTLSNLSYGIPRREASATNPSSVTSARPRTPANPGGERRTPGSGPRGPGLGGHRGLLPELGSHADVTPQAEPVAWLARLFTGRHTETKASR